MGALDDARIRIETSDEGFDRLAPVFQRRLRIQMAEIIRQFLYHPLRGACYLGEKLLRQTTFVVVGSCENAGDVVRIKIGREQTGDPGVDSIDQFGRCRFAQSLGCTQSR